MFSASILTVLALHVVMLGLFGLQGLVARRRHPRPDEPVGGHERRDGGVGAGDPGAVSLRGVSRRGFRHPLAARDELPVRQPRAVPFSRRAVAHEAPTGPRPSSTAQVPAGDGAARTPVEWRPRLDRHRVHRRRLRKFRTNIHGVPVLGGLEQVAPLLASGNVAQVVVATSAVSPERLEALTRPRRRGRAHARGLAAVQGRPGFRRHPPLDICTGP